MGPKKDPKAPKKPQSAYLMWCNEEREKIKARHPNLGFSRTAFELGCRWGNAPPTEKAKFQEKYKEEKEKYDAVLSEYKLKMLSEVDDNAGAGTSKDIGGAESASADSSNAFSVLMKGGSAKKPVKSEPKPVAKKTPAKKGQKGPKVCRPDCKVGLKSGCPIKSKGKCGVVSCVEIHEKLKSAGITNPARTSRCVKSAIMKGFITLTGEKSDLDMVIHEDEGECGHRIKAKLGDLLKQPDYAGLDYEDGLQEATVLCTVEGCEEGRTYVTRICEGAPAFDCGKFHNHCKKCPGYGRCIYDYRNSCGCRSRSGKGGFVGLSGRRKKDCTTM